MKILVSVRNVDEALLVARGGADFIDLKEPRDGALGALSIATIQTIVDAVRRNGITLALSATIGDVPMSDMTRIADRVEAVGACGVDYVKVGIENAPAALKVLDMLAESGRPIVPVFIADKGLDMTHVSHACALGFSGVMVDTADKHAGSLFDVASMAQLHRFVSIARQGRMMVGLAGALRSAHFSLLAEIGPDFAGFRTAVCTGDRTSAVDVQKLQSLTRAIRGDAVLDVA
jgi:uncharacterized protein (UPF0264 family)